MKFASDNYYVALLPDIGCITDRLIIRAVSSPILPTVLIYTWAKRGHWYDSLLARKFALRDISFYCLLSARCPCCALLPLQIPRCMEVILTFGAQNIKTQETLLNVVACAQIKIKIKIITDMERKCKLVTWKSSPACRLCDPKQFMHKHSAGVEVGTPNCNIIWFRNE